MSDHAIVPAMLQPRRRARYLKIIALFKIGKGLLLLALGISLLFLNGRDTWMDKISDWADAEILLGHSKTVTFLLNKLQDVLAGGQLRATAFLALFYCGVLFTEGTGVYLQKRWAELLMIFATASLIPPKSGIRAPLESGQPFSQPTALSFGSASRPETREETSHTRCASRTNRDSRSAPVWR
jgi:uncharacterized membrane protein (DUF2068 family)